MSQTISNCYDEAKLRHECVFRLFAQVHLVGQKPSLKDSLVIMRS